MKTYFPSLITFIFTLGLFAQTPNYRTVLKTELSKYNIESKTIQDKLLNENIAKAFNYVIFSSSDLATNSSAFGYTQNEEKTKVSINANLRLRGELSPLYLKVGANATGGSNIFDFYSDKSWNNNVSLNLGLILKIGNASTFYNGEDFNLTHLKREINASAPLYAPNKYNQSTINKIDNLKQDILNVNVGADVIKSYASLLKELPQVKKLISEKKYEEAYTKLNEEGIKIQEYIDNKGTQTELENYIKDTVLYNFDKENDITYGYSLQWFDLNLNLGNSTYSFTEENIDNTILTDFNTIFDLTESLNKLKSTISFNYNIIHNGQKTVWFLQGGTSVTSSSFLENSLINGTPEIIKNDNQEYILQDEDQQILGRFKDIKENFKTGTFNAYGAIFFTKKKNFGFNIAFSHNYLIDKPTETYYKNNFTTLFGPIFRKVKDGKTSLTFGIDLGWENARYNTKISNDFTGRIRLGIPFRIFNKNKS